jgi:polar amino acid transport system permease protein
MEFDFAFALDTLPELLRALCVTVQATLLGMALASVVGLVWAVLRRSNNRAIAGGAWFAVEFLRSTPLLVQIYFLFYILPDLGLRMSPMITGVLALGLHYSAYLAEVYRAGIEGVDSGQWQAATALNLSAGQTWTRIVLPQALPPMTPAIGNYLIAMFKDSPMLSAITVLELLQTAKIIGSDTFRYLEPLTMVGVLFLVVSLIASGGIRWTERRFGMRGAMA